MNIKKTIIRLLVSLIVIIITACAVGYFIIKHGDSVVQKLAANSATDNHQLPREYLHVFKNNRNLRSLGTFYSKTRNPISIYTYNADDEIVLYELPILTIQPLNKVLKEYDADMHITYGIDYMEILDDPYILDTLDVKINTPFQILCKVGLPIKSNEIYLTLSGKNKNVIELNDTIAYYHLLLNNFSMRYKADGDQDFFGRVRDDSLRSKFPLEIMFYKRNQNIYFMVMAIRNKNAVMNVGTLYNLIFKR